MSRKRLGIIFNFSTGWLGGIIYILNIVKTLNFLADNDKPEVFLFYNEDTSRFLDEIEYPYLYKIKWDFTPLVQGYLSSWLTQKNRFISKMIKIYNLDAIYPVFNHPVKGTNLPRKVRVVSWFADLQHKYYPEFFTRKQLLMREVRLRFMLRNTSNLVVSSQAVADDFNKFYKLRNELKVHIYHFTSIIDSFNFLNITELTQRYNLPENYYLVSNQFHNHKNHKILFEAANLLKQRGKGIHIAMTGKFPKKQSSPYISELHHLIDSLGLKDNMTFLGVITRHEQLSLMHHCQAVIQPSLFEGWSTVIEDAISIQAPVIASDLKVNIEQLGDNGVFFSPHKAQELADILAKYPLRNSYSKNIYEDYTSRVKRGASQLLKILLSDI